MTWFFNRMVKVASAREGLELLVGLVLALASSQLLAQFNPEEMFERARQEQFDLGVQLGDKQMIEAAGGHVAGVLGAGGRVFRPGEDVMATLEAEHNAAMRRLNGGGDSSRAPWWLGGGQSGPGNAAAYSSPTQSFFEEKRAAARAELVDLVKTTAERSTKPALREQSVEQASASDYLPSIKGLLRDFSTALRSESSVDLPTDDIGFQPLATWLAGSGQTVQEGVRVFGFIEQGDLSACRFVDDKAAELKIPDWSTSLASSREDVDGADGGSSSFKIAMPMKMASLFQETVSRFLRELDLSREQRNASNGANPNPTAVYRWIFGQLIDEGTANYLPFVQVCPRAPRIRLAVCGITKLDGDEKVIESTRLLITTTPLATQARFIAANKGVPAVLIDAGGAYETAFIECPLFCKDKGRWLRERPALTKVSSEPNAYLRSMLVASPEDIEKMHKQLREEIQSATSVALETSLSEVEVFRGLKAAGVDKRKLDAQARIFTKGVGRTIVDGILALASGQAVPAEAVRVLAEDRWRFSKLAKEPRVAAFVAENLVDTFLILAVDQEGVSLCDFRAMLSVHGQYATIGWGKGGEDLLENACRFAEIANWLHFAASGEPVPVNPPFSELPAAMESRRKLIEDFHANVASQERPDASSEIKQDDELPETARSDFVFPGS